MPVGYQHENNGTKSRLLLHNNHHHNHNHYLHHKTVIVVTVISGLIFLSSLAVINTNRTNFIAYAQLANNNINTVFPDNGPNTDRPPAFLDAYWTNNLSGNSSVPSNAAKKEVGPGDGTSTLAIVLVNRGRSDITGVTGYLDLPAGFKPIAGKNNGTSQSVASFYSVVKAGNTFVLYFDMDVLNQAKVGGYSTLLNIKYSKIVQMGQLMTTISVPFRLTGRVTLDTVSENKELTPGSPNLLKVNIQNKGSANATAVVVTITGVTGNSINSGSGTTSSGSVNSGITSTSNTVATNANSNATVQQPSSSSAMSSSSSASSPLSAPAINLASQTFNVGKIPVNGSVQITPTVYPISSAGETAQNLNLQISYGDAYGNQKTTNAQVGLVIAPNPPQSVLNLTNNNNGNALILTAGKIQPLGFTLQNSDRKSITNVVASLNSESDSMKILGDSRWTVQSMLPQSNVNLSTKVFASSNIIGQPTLFTLTVQYVSAGQSKTDSLNLGAYITGEIKLRVYDVRINNIGNIPNLVGNILNEGNTVGLFTTVQIINDHQLDTSSSPSSSLSTSPQGSSGTKLGNSSQQRQQQYNAVQGGNEPSSSQPKRRSLADFMAVPPPPQYLGDLSVDSPLPFSIPLVSNNSTIITAPAGIYPVILKITYSDDLKIPHQFIDNNKTVSFQGASQFADRERGAGGGLGVFGAVLGGGQRGDSSNAINGIIIIAAIVAAISIAALYIRRRRSRSKLHKLQASKPMGKDPFLDD